MKKFGISICLVFALFLAGCGKKDEENGPKKDAKIVAQSQEIPVVQSDDGYFDFEEGFEEGDVKNFAFLEDNNEVAQTDEDDVFDDDEWEDLSLAWDDEEMINQEYDFKVVNFDLNKNNIREDQRPVVTENVKLAEKAVKKEGKKIVVAGHCCPLGSASFNMSLSERRAKTIRDEMVRKGIPEKDITILGCGSESPIALSDATDRKQRIKEFGPNRRAEISLG